MTRRELLSKLSLTAGGSLLLFLGACRKKAPWEEPGDTEMRGGEPDRVGATGEAGGVDSGGAEGGASYVPPEERPAGSNSAEFSGDVH